jgi:hypothetical protein
MSFKTILNTIIDIFLSSMGQVHGWVDHFLNKKGNCFAVGVITISTFY